MPEPKISFAASADSSVVSAYTIELLRSLLATADCPSCTITSTTRTPLAQARAMYANIVNLGAASQLALYAAAGDAVVEECVRTRRAGLAPASIIAAMTAKLLEVGPSKVSLHCADPTKLNVIDIAPYSIADPIQFSNAISAARSSGKITRFFSPGTHDPAFHIEVPQRFVE